MDMEQKTKCRDYFVFSFFHTIIINLLVLHVNHINQQIKLATCFDYHQTLNSNIYLLR